jgi:putative oxidoreductase
MSYGESIAPLLGRLVLTWFFLTQVYHYALDWNGTALLLTMKHVPAAPVMLLFGLMLALLGSFSLLLGFRTRIGALALFAATVAATVTFHDYWTLKTAAAAAADYDIFARNVAIAGGLLILIGVGPGRFAVDQEKPHVAAKHH